jgi:hypothetical protein
MISTGIMNLIDYPASNFKTTCNYMIISHL